MVNEPLRSRIDRFVAQVGSVYDKVERVPADLESDVLDRYIPTAIKQPYGLKGGVLSVLENSIRTNSQHGNLARWSNACKGVAKFLLLPTQIEEVEPEFAADVVVRISRWYYTNDNNLWKAFSPTSRAVVEMLWGNIENLYLQCM